MEAYNKQQRQDSFERIDQQKSPSMACFRATKKKSHRNVLLSILSRQNEQYRFSVAPSFAGSDAYIIAHWKDVAFVYAYLYI